MDIVITYNNYKYIIEMKIWRGQKYHEKGIKQLCDYLEINDLDKGYLVIFNFNKNKEYKEELINADGKDIAAIFVWKIFFKTINYVKVKSKCYN